MDTIILNKLECILFEAIEMTDKSPVGSSTFIRQIENHHKQKWKKTFKQLCVLSWWIERNSTNDAQNHILYLWNCFHEIRVIFGEQMTQMSQRMKVAAFFYYTLYSISENNVSFFCFFFSLVDRFYFIMLFNSNFHII